MKQRGYTVEGRALVGAYIDPHLKAELIELAYRRQVSLSELIRDGLHQVVSSATQEAVTA